MWLLPAYSFIVLTESPLNPETFWSCISVGCLLVVPFYSNWLMFPITRPNLEVLTENAKHLDKVISDTNELAVKVSSKVRILDLAKVDKSKAMLPFLCGCYVSTYFTMLIVSTFSFVVLIMILLILVCLFDV